MKTAEKLARQIRRVAELRGRVAGVSIGVVRFNGGSAMAVIDAALEQACKAVGVGDDGAMVAAGLELEAIGE